MNHPQRRSQPRSTCGTVGQTRVLVRSHHCHNNEKQGFPLRACRDTAYCNCTSCISPARPLELGRKIHGKPHFVTQRKRPNEPCTPCQDCPCGGLNFLSRTTQKILVTVKRVGTATPSPGTHGRVVSETPSPLPVQHNAAKIDGAFRNTTASRI